MRYNNTRPEYIAELCKGSTTVSDSVCLGSNPSSAAKKILVHWNEDFFISYIHTVGSF